MPITKDQKKEILDSLKQKVVKQKAMVFIDFTGLKVKDMTILRKKMRDAKGEIKAAKKTLIGLAFKDAKIDVNVKEMRGEMALALGYEDEVSPSKIIWQFSQENKNLKILGGLLENKFVGAEQVAVLAQLPSKEQLLAKLVGTMQAPVSNFVYVLKGNLKGLVYALNAIKDSKQ